MPLCEIKNLRKTYPSFTLTDLSFQLNAGEIVGFIGRNGAGKTTTIKSMLGLIHPDGGEVCYFGLPFWGHEEEIKQRIGYSTGAVNYYPKKKIRNIVSVTKTFSLHGMTELTANIFRSLLWTRTKHHRSFPKA